VSASRPARVTIHCNQQFPPGCVAYVTGAREETETALRSRLARRKWTVNVREGMFTADYCPAHPPVPHKENQ
jgi:hypothetical protein